MIEKYIVEDTLVRDKNRKIDWKASYGSIVKIFYDGEVYDIKVLDVVSTDNSTIIAVDYNGSTKKIATGSLMNGRIGVLVDQISYEYKYKIGDVVNGTTILSFEKQIRKNGKTARAYNIQCLKCGYINQNVAETAITKQRNCPVCSNKLIIPGVNDIATTHPDIAQYILDKDLVHKISYGYNKKIKFKCPECGNIIESTIHNIRILGHIPCRVCGDGFSYPEKLMHNILLDLKIDFENAFIIPNAYFYFRDKPYRPTYDFVLEFDKKYIVEMDGGYHDIPHQKSDKSIDDIKYIDRMKDLLAEQNGYTIIRIDSRKSEFEFILNNLKQSVLSKYIPFNKINKSIINKNAYKSKMIEICRLYDFGLSIKEIAAETKYKEQTIGKYLKRGALNGLCTYTVKDSYKRSNSLTDCNASKKVICLNNLKVYASMTEAARQIGLKSTGNISSCCNNKRKHAGNDPITKEPLKWMYYEDYIERKKKYETNR